jgi:hypothetical protein
VTLPDVGELLRTDGLYPDPDKVTELARFFRSANSGVAASLVVHTSPALLIGFTVSSVAAQFIQVFDALSLPADATVPTLSFAVAATNHLSVNYALAPRGFRSGIVICNSSTQHAKTIGSADCIFDVQYL